jgi:hypothetical protein
MQTLSFLQDITLGDASSFGDEAASLGDLTKAGVPVSPAFVLPAAAYGEFLARREVKSVLGLCDSKKPEEFHRLLMGISLPTRLAKEIEGFYRSLSGPRDILVSVRSIHAKKQVDDVPSLLSTVKRFWIDHLLTVCERGGNFFKEPLPIIVQQVVNSNFSGNLHTSSPEVGSTDFCAIEVEHPSGKERFIFEKGTSDATKRIVSGAVEAPTATEEVVDLVSWAQKIEQILGGSYTVSWKNYRGEFIFEEIKRAFLPKLRTAALEIWSDVDSIPESAEGSWGFVVRDAEVARGIAKKFPSHKVILLLEDTNFKQIDDFREARHKEGFKNLHIALPPVRTVDGLREMKRHLSGERIQRGPHLKFFFRAFYPTNVVLLKQFLEVGIDGVIFDEAALARGLLGAETKVEPDESLTWAITEASKTCKSEKVEMLYLGDRARSWVLFELVRCGVKGIIVPQKHQKEFGKALQEAEGERLSSSV